MHYRRILHLSPGVQGLLRSPGSSTQPIETKAAEGAKRVVIFVHIHVVRVEAVEGPSGTTAGEEDVEGVGATEEGGKSSVGVAMEGVVEGAPRTSRAATTGLQAWAGRGMGWRVGKDRKTSSSLGSGPLLMPPLPLKQVPRKGEVCS